MLITILLLIAGLYVAVAALMYTIQPRLLYAPSQELYQTPANHQLQYEDVYLTGADGGQLHGWFIPHQASPKRQTLLFLHGNAGNIADRVDSLKEVAQRGFAVFVIDYRGYGNSDGRPTEDGTYRDAHSAWKYLADERQIAPRDIIIWGRSLGGAVAVWLAESVRESGGLIVESTFASLPRLAQRLYPWLPAKYLVRYRYDSLSRAARLEMPILSLHSPTDEVIPIEEGRLLFNAFRDPKQFVEISGDHASGYATTGAPYWTALSAFADSLPRP
ncbi:MAG: alpha/beta fold hydrolase [Gammaproteobacteria bacterium]|nr:alpha/beta fold hydrolase [Gammaproteobacteria bacterium]